MITLAQLQAAIAQHKTALPPGSLMRWAFLVTAEEIASLVDECQNGADTGLRMNALQAQHVKECRALLHIDGVAVMPELIAAPPSTLDS